MCQAHCQILDYCRWNYILIITTHIILQFLVVDDTGTDPIQKVLGMGHKDQDMLESFSSSHTETSRSRWLVGSSRSSVKN